MVQINALLFAHRSSPAGLPACKHGVSERRALSSEAASRIETHGRRPDVARVRIQVESGRAVLGVRRDPVGVVGTDRHQAVRNSEEGTKI